MGKQFIQVTTLQTLYCFLFLCFQPLLYAQEQNFPPVITFSQPSYDLVPGLEVTIRCLVDSPDSPLEEVTWLKNGAPLPTDNRIAIKTGTGFRSSDLVISQSDVSDEGTYTCSAKNQAGVGSMDVALSMGNPFGEGQIDVFGNIAGERVEPSVFGDNNINVFGDVQGEMVGSLSSPDVVSSVGAISVVDPAVQDPGVVDTPVGDPVAAGTVDADTNGVDVATNAPVVDQVVADNAVVDNPAVVDVTNPSPVIDPVVDPVVPDTVIVDAPVDETVLTPVVDAAVVDTAAIVEEIKPETQQTGMLNPTSNTDALTPVDPKTDTPKKAVVNKPETKEAPAPKRDRIIGGIGGGGFMGGKEKAGLCSSQCRTNTDSCYRPVNCTHYETCFAQTGSLCECTKIRCAFGTFWNPQINNCDAVNSVNCETDPCLTKKPTETYPSGINCRSYYKCSWQNTSMPYCCEEGFAYDDAEGRCVGDEACTIPCSVDSSNFNRQGDVTTKAPKYECFFRPVKGRPKKYWNEMANQEQDCPASLVYRPDICVCGNPLESETESKVVPIPVKKCDPVVFVDFTGKSIVNKSPRRIWIDPTDTQITRSEKGAQYGRFNGITSRISIPFLSGMSITKLMARLRFFTAGTQGPDSQVLFSNCETETVRWNSPEINKDLSPSIAIILNRKLNRLVFLGSTEDRASEQVMMLLPFKKNDWNNVELMFDGAELSARVRVVGKDKQALEFKNSTALTGRLTPAQKPMQIGRCNDQDGFFGYLDMVKIYDCTP